MKILHTGDWHLGKRLLGLSRHAEQERVMKEIAEIADKESVDLILVAGDIFDVATPPAESEELFYNAVTRMAERRPVAVLAGNHDDPVRLAAAKGLAAKHNIILLCEMRKKSGRGITASGEGWIRIKCGEETCALVYAPYLDEARMQREADSRKNFDGDKDEFTANFEETDENPVLEDAAATDARTYSQRMGDLYHAGAEDAFTADSVNILTGHLFMAGGEKTGEEREIELGTARLINADDLPEAHYTALGHIHRRQTVSKRRNIFYSGSIMQYAQNDTKPKCVIIAELTKEGLIRTEDIPLKSPRPLLTADVEDADGGAAVLEENPQALVFLRIHSAGGITDRDYRRLHGYENFVSATFIHERAEREEAVAALKERTDSEIFTEYYGRQKGGKPSDDLLNLFLELINEEDAAE